MIITREFESSSSSAIYHAQFDTDTRQGSCDCPAWRFKKTGQDRACKHTRQLAAETVRSIDGSTTLAASLAPAPAAPGCRPAACIKPMLASAMTDGATLDDFTGPEWVLEEKFDGHRVLVRKSGDGLDAWSRPRAGSDPITRELPPHVAAALAQLPAGVYDGELLVPGGTSSDVTRLDKQRELRFVVFDVLEVMGESTTGKTYAERRELLALALAHATDDQTLDMPRTEAVSLEAVKRIWSRGGEGAIVKRLASHYRAGWRSPEWVKVKRHAAAELTITGFTAGKCGPYSIANLRADDGRETTVKTLDNATRDDIAKDPARYIGARLVVAFIEQTSKGNFRHITWDHITRYSGDSPRPRRATAPKSARPSVTPAPAPVAPTAARPSSDPDWRRNAALKAAETRRRNAERAGGARA